MMAFPVVADQNTGFLVSQVFDTLLRSQGEFHPKPFVSCIYEAVRVATEPMHMAEALRNAPVAHDDCNLVKRLRKKGPKVPVVLGATQASSRVTLDRMVEIRKAQRVPEEKYWCVVADEIPVALIC